jgi:hypothetical protein
MKMLQKVTTITTFDAISGFPRLNQYNGHFRGRPRNSVIREAFGLEAV